MIKKINQLESNNKELIKKQKPQIRTVTKDKRDKPYVLLEPTTLLDINSLISFIYERENDFEDIMAIGKVYDINEKGYIVIEILEELFSKTDIYEKFLNRDTDILLKTTIKPYLKYGIVEEMRNNILKNIIYQIKEKDND